MFCGDVSKYFDGNKDSCYFAAILSILFLVDHDLMYSNKIDLIMIGNVNYVFFYDYLMF